MNVLSGAPWTMARVREREGYIPELHPYFPAPDHAEAVRANINWLIESCYRPADDNHSGRRAREDSPDGAINWGDLSCVDVERIGEGENARWLATVEEASPDAVELQRWLEDWLGRWGWCVEVRTEW